MPLKGYLETLLKIKLTAQNVKENAFLKSAMRELHSLLS